MIRPLREEDYSAAVAIVNDGWRTVYGEYVNPALLSDAGCRERAAELERDFRSRRLEEHVWEEAGEALAKRGVAVRARLLAYGEALAREKGRREVVIWAFRKNTAALAFYRSHGYCLDKTEQLGEPYMAEGVRLIKRVGEEDSP